MTSTRLSLWWLIAGGFVVGLVVLAAGHVRYGGYICAGALTCGGLLRLVLPGTKVGALAVRRRSYDAVYLIGLGIALAVVVAALDLRPRG